MNVQCARGCGVRNFIKVHVTYHVLKRMKIFHVQMVEAAVLKLKRTIFRWRLHKVGCIRFMHLYKIYFVQIVFMWRNHKHILQSLQDCKMHLFRLNWIFKPFNTNLLSKRKLTCNLGTWSTFLYKFGWYYLSQLLL